jgi:hypothetical protein
MFNWIKKGRIYTPANHPDRPEWMMEFAQAPYTLLLEDRLRVYFGCRPPRDANGQYVTYTGFVDLNRDNLMEILAISKTPVLELGQKGTFDEFGTYPFSVLSESNEIWAYYAGWTRCESVPFNVAVGMAKSTDSGETFERVGPGPVLPYSPDEPFTISGPKIKKFNGQFYLFYIAGKKWISVNGKPEISHKIRMATSEDGLHWNKMNRDIIPNGWDETEAQASPDVFFANGIYHMFFCGWVPTSFREKPNRRIGYAYSSDLINWTRDDAKVGIHPSDEGWDSEMIAYPHVFELNNKIYMLYLGNEVGRYGFGIAELNGDLAL